MYEPQEGTWTLTAPDGRQWTGASGLLAAAAEQRERIPATVQLERIFAELEPTEDEQDAARYRWLVENSFDREGVAQMHVWLHTWEPHSLTGEPTEWKQRVRGPALDRMIDAAMDQTPNKY